jgi:hypothetical protein
LLQAYSLYSANIYIKRFLGLFIRNNTVDIPDIHNPKSPLIYLTNKNNPNAG